MSNTNNDNNNYIHNYIGTYLRNFKFAATSSKQRPWTVQQIWLYRSHFLLQIACLNSSNQTIIILPHISKKYFYLFISKQSFDRGTIAKIVAQQRWSCCYKNQFYLLVVILFNFWINNPQMKTIYWKKWKFEGFWIVGYRKMSVRQNAILQYIPKMN